MPLISILGVCVLLASPLDRGPLSASVLPVLQETQPPQDSPPAQTPPELTKPAEEGKPDQAPASQPAPAPEAEKPPQSSPPAEISKPQEKTKSTATKRRKRGTKPKPVQPDTGSAKVVVRDGGTTEPTVQLAPGLSQEQASRKLQNTNQLLATTEGNLKQIAARQLDASQQDLVKQIRKYVEQAKTAVGAGDLQRARNLAFKAHQLSDELVKPK